MLKNSRVPYQAKKLREYYGAKWTEEGAEYEACTDVVYQILQKSGECMKLEEIYEAFFTREGKDYDNDSKRGAVREALQKLCEQGKAVHPEHGYYQAK